MKKIITLLLCFAAIGFSSNNIYATTVSAASSGNWENGSTWTNGSVPQCGDTVIIGSGITITVTTVLDYFTCSQPMHLFVMGTLHFQTGKKLKLPCGSIVQISLGGLISAGNGGGNSNFIEICGVIVWNAAQGNLPGPATLQVAPLPVDWIHISAKKTKKLIVVEWTTGAEINNDYFTIEKSSNGNSFEEIGKLKGGGTTNNISSYTFNDPNPIRGLQYYRLKQTDYNGEFKISLPVTVKWSSEQEFRVYPNPTYGELFVDLPEDYSQTTGVLTFIASDGREVLSKPVSFNENIFGISILKRAEFLNSGSYLLRLDINGKKFLAFVVVK